MGAVSVLVGLISDPVFDGKTLKVIDAIEAEKAKTFYLTFYLT